MIMHHNMSTSTLPVSISISIFIFIFLPGVYLLLSSVLSSSLLRSNPSTWQTNLFGSILEGRHLSSLVYRVRRSWATWPLDARGTRCLEANAAVWVVGVGSSPGFFFFSSCESRSAHLLHACIALRTSLDDSELHHCTYLETKGRVFYLFFFFFRWPKEYRVIHGFGIGESWFRVENGRSNSKIYNHTSTPGPEN